MQGCFVSFSLPRAVVLLLVTATPLLAQAAPTPGEQDLIRDRQDRLLEEQRRRLEELKDLPGKAATPAPQQAPQDSRCFNIDSIELKGADSLSAGERVALLKPWLGRCLGVTQLNDLLRAVTNLYIAKGLVTSRAYLPQQDLPRATCSSW